MTRQFPGACPVPNCGGKRAAWQAFCHACWCRLPVDLRATIDAAKMQRAPHLIAKAEIAATAWLGAHPASAEINRLLGEHETPPSPP